MNGYVWLLVELSKPHTHEHKHTTRQAYNYNTMIKYNRCSKSLATVTYTEFSLENVALFAWPFSTYWAICCSSVTCICQLQTCLCSSRLCSKNVLRNICLRSHGPLCVSPWTWANHSVDNSNWVHGMDCRWEMFMISEQFKKKMTLASHSYGSRIAMKPLRRSKNPLHAWCGEAFSSPQQYVRNDTTKSGKSTNCCTI